MTHFDETLDFIDRIESAPNAQAISGELLSITSRYGLDLLIGGTMPTPRANRSAQMENVLFQGWPVSWLQRYIERGYVFVDPVIRRIQANLSPFDWADAEPDPAHRESATQVMAEAREHGLGAGFAVPLITLEGDIAAVSLGGERMDVPPKAQGMISLISTYAMGRAIQLRAKASPKPREPLTPREVECIRWAAAGKSEWEIGTILNISEHTAERHLLNAKNKLCAVNRVQAVAEAIRSGIIR